MDKGINNYPEKGHCRSTVQGAVGDFRLASKVLGILDGRNHPLDREEGGQVGGVRRNDDQSEEPPNSTHDSCACRLQKWSTWRRLPTFTHLLIK
jgi:hypothetical protein